MTFKAPSTSLMFRFDVYVSSPFQHDDRDGEKTWIDNRGRGRGSFPARRGRFVYRKGGSSPKWTHDMYQGGEEGELGDDGLEVDHKEAKNAGEAPSMKQ